jgi:hypothetical protein
MNAAIKKILAVTFLSTVLLIPISASLHATYAHAQSSGSGTTVPGNSDFSFNEIMGHLEKFSLSKFAVQMAKQMLHMLTNATVNWINNGFQGNPSFISNPQSFFTDVADQMTGAFLNQYGGPLNNLCGDLSTDITLALAFGQTSTINQRYTCTLGAIFNNAINLPNNTRINGRSLTSFMKGDFSQGGWGGFIAMTQMPQNNSTGAYLQAHSDLLQSIGIKKNTIDKGIQSNGGLLSHESCDKVPVPATTANTVGLPLSQSSQAAVKKQTNPSITLGEFGNGSLYGNYSTPNDFQSSVNGVNSLTTKTVCHTDTPGSLIAGLMNKVVQSPILEAELANDMNSIFTALGEQFVTKMINGNRGFGGLSNNSSGTGVSQTQQVINNITAQNASAPNTIPLVNLSSATGDQNKAKYDAAVAALTGSVTNLTAARACFTNLPNLTAYQQVYASGKINLVNTSLAQVNTLLAALKVKQAQAASLVVQLNNSNGSITDAQDSSGLQQQIPGIEQSVRNGLDINSQIAANSTVATQDLADAQTQATQFNTLAAQYQSDCDNTVNVNQYSQGYTSTRNR